MKKFTALMIAGLLLTLFASLASAQTGFTAETPCSGIVAISGSALAGGTQTGTSTCNITINIPAGSTVDDISIMIEQDSSVPTQVGSTVNGTYVGSGLVVFTQTLSEVGSVGSFGACTGSPTAGPCPVTSDYAYSGGAGTETVSYSISETNGGPSTFNGSTGINVFWDISYASGTPEPATLGISGAGLIALGLIARKRRNRKVVG